MSYFGQVQTLPGELTVSPAIRFAPWSAHVHSADAAVSAHGIGKLDQMPLSGAFRQLQEIKHKKNVAGIPNRLATNTDSARLARVVSASLVTSSAAPQVRFSLLKNHSTSMRSLSSLASRRRDSLSCLAGRPGPRPHIVMQCFLQKSRFSLVR